MSGTSIIAQIFVPLSDLHVIFSPALAGKELTLCPWEFFSRFFCRLLIFSKSSFSKNSFRSTIRVSNSLDPDQA